MVHNLNGNMRNCETKRFFQFREITQNTFFRIFVFFSVSRNDRNSAKQWPVSYSFVFRETKKIRNCQAYPQHWTYNKRKYFIFHAEAPELSDPMFLHKTRKFVNIQRQINIKSLNANACLLLKNEQQKNTEMKLIFINLFKIPYLKVMLHNLGLELFNNKKFLPAGCRKPIWQLKKLLLLPWNSYATVTVWWDNGGNRAHD